MWTTAGQLPVPQHALVRPTGEVVQPLTVAASLRSRHPWVLAWVVSRRACARLQGRVRRQRGTLRGRGHESTGAARHVGTGNDPPTLALARAALREVHTPAKWIAWGKVCADPRHAQHVTLGVAIWCLNGHVIKTGGPRLQVLVLVLVQGRQGALGGDQVGPARAAQQGEVRTTRSAMCAPPSP